MDSKRKSAALMGRSQSKGVSFVNTVSKGLLSEDDLTVGRRKSTLSKKRGSKKPRGSSSSIRDAEMILEEPPPPAPIPELPRQKYDRLVASLGPTPEDGRYACVRKLRRYDSEPALVTPFVLRNMTLEPGEGKVGKAKTVEDVILTKTSYPALVTEHLQPEKVRTYIVTEKMKHDWKELEDLESKRYSFFDELIAGGFVVDSLEVPSRMDDITYLVEADLSNRNEPVEYARIVFKSKTVFTGNLVNWFFQGPGRYIWLDGTIYQGEFRDGLMHGEGVLLFPDGCFFEGEFSNGERTGWGIYTTPSGLMYAGDWVKGLPHGQGKVWYNPKKDDGDYYDGNWVKGKIHGFGTREYSNGDRYIGSLSDGVRKGQGTMIWLAERQVYKGEWADGVPDGFGEHIWYLPRSSTNPYPERNVYKGDFVDGLRHGIGRMVYACGSIYDGRWQHGVKHGKGLYINPAGEVLFGLFRYGSVSGGPDIPLHVPSYACKFRSLVGVLQQRLHTGDTPVAHLEEDYLSDTVTRYLCHIRSLYKRAGYLGEWWGNQGHYPEWIKKHKHSPASHHLHGHNVIKDPILQSIESQVYDSGEDIDEEEPWLHGHKPHFGSPDHVNPVTRFGLWLLLKDCPGVLTDLTLAELDLIWNSVTSISFQTRHHPFEPVQLWQFIQCLIVISSMLYIEIPKRNYHYATDIEENEEPFEADEEPRLSSASSADSKKTDEGIPPVTSPGKHHRHTKSNDSALDIGKSKPSAKNVSASRSHKKLSAIGAISRASIAKGGGKQKSKTGVKSTSRFRLGQSPKEIKVIKTSEETGVQTEGRYKIEKDSQEAQTNFEVEPEPHERDFMLSEAFELFLVDLLIPCLERRPGKYLPKAPNPLPALSDLYAAFNVVSPVKDVMSAREFLIRALQHRQIPLGSSIYWTRSRALVTPDIKMENILSHFRDSIASVGVEVMDYDFLGERLSNTDIFSDEIIGQEQDWTGRSGSIKILGEGNTIFGDRFSVEEGKGDFGPTYDVTDIDSLPLGEHDLTSVPFLWATDPVCTQVVQNAKVFDNLEISDVLKILRQFYPKTSTCDRSNVINLEFNLTFGDWIWLNTIVAKRSTDRAFCQWMQAESEVEHKRGRCRQMDNYFDKKEQEDE